MSSTEQRLAVSKTSLHVVVIQKATQDTSAPRNQEFCLLGALSAHLVCLKHH